MTVNARHPLPCRKRVVIALLSLAAAMTTTADTTDDGWFEIETNLAMPVAASWKDAGRDDSPSSIGRSGDRLWIVGDTDSFSEIARVTTGSVLHAESIAHYNQLDSAGTPQAGTTLLIPERLLLLNVDESNRRSEIREFRVTDVDEPAQESDLAPASALATAPEGVTVSPVGKEVVVVDQLDGASKVERSQPVDMFAGEVRVLGEVDVTRVAIGNGAIVRAEVLATGELLVIAQAAGSTSLRLWNTNGSQDDFNIRVSESDPETRVRMERMVKMRVRLVEFRKSALGRLGIDWSDGAAGPGFAAAGDAIGNNLFRPATEGFDSLPNSVAPFSTYFGIASNITSRINFLASNGDAVTLAEPVLSAMNGGTASFLAGGEVPYPTVNSNGGTTVEFKEYGIKLKVTPRIDSAGNVRAGIETEISQLDPAVSVQGAPGLLTRRAQTEINVRSGETIVISGLLSSEHSKDIDRIPGLGRLPVIGSLFRSKNTRNAVTELVVFVTPEVVEPESMALGAREKRIEMESTARFAKARDQLPLMD